MSSPASSPDAFDVDASDVPGPASCNLRPLYFISAILACFLLCLAIRYGRWLLSEWRAGAGTGTDHGPPLDTSLGLSVDDIAALPTFTYGARAAPTPSPQGSSGKKRSRSKGRAAASVECVVCLQELEDGDVVRVLPACMHFFHGSCIDAWLLAHSSCPLCRAPAHPEPEHVLPGEAALWLSSQLRRCDVYEDFRGNLGTIAVGDRRLQGEDHVQVTLTGTNGA